MSEQTNKGGMQIKPSRNVLWNDRDQRMRAFWRIVLAFVLFVAIARSTNFLLHMISSGETAVPPPGAILSMLVLLLVLWLMAKYVDKRPFAQYGFVFRSKGSWINFLFGFVLAALVVTAVFALEWQLGWVAITGTFVHPDTWDFIPALLLSLLQIMATAIFIELFFRGYLVINLGEAFGFLSVLYQPNPQLERLNRWQMLLNTIYHRLPALTAWLAATALYLFFRTSEGMGSSVLLLNLMRASFLLTLPFLLTRNLGLSIGLNTGWNIFVQLVFGFVRATSSPTGASLLGMAQRGPKALTGGEVGLEGGFLGMAAIILIGFVVMAWIKWWQKRLPPEFDPWVFAYKRENGEWRMENEE